MARVVYKPRSRVIKTMPKRNEEQRIRHKEYMRKYNKTYRVPDSYKIKKRQYSKLPHSKLWRSEYKKRPYVKLKRRNNIKINRGDYLRQKVRLSVIHQKTYISTIHKLIGCDVPTARFHLESQFEDWMTWDNYGIGKGKWCIDHKDAIGNVDLDDEEAVKRVFHYTNMQPMEYIKNCIKGKS